MEKRKYVSFIRPIILKMIWIAFGAFLLAEGFGWKEKMIIWGVTAVLELFYTKKLLDVCKGTQFDSSKKVMLGILWSYIVILVVFNIYDFGGIMLCILAGGVDYSLKKLEDGVKEKR